MNYPLWWTCRPGLPPCPSVSPIPTTIPPIAIPTGAPAACWSRTFSWKARWRVTVPPPLLLSNVSVPCLPPGHPGVSVSAGPARPWTRSAAAPGAARWLRMNISVSPPSPAKPWPTGCAMTRPSLLSSRRSSPHLIFFSCRTRFTAIPPSGPGLPQPVSVICCGAPCRTKPC